MNIQWNKIELQRSSIELLIIDVNFSEARNFPNLFSPIFPDAKLAGHQ